jgi:sigma-B regulation protein RsbU (phosphoserine phosphatase)
VTLSAIILPAVAGASLALLCMTAVRFPRRGSVLPLDDPGFRGFAGSLAVTIIVITADLGRVLYASPGFRAVFGADPSEVDFRELKDRVHEEDAESLESALRSGGESPFAIEFRLLSGGETHWIHMRGFPVPGRRKDARIALWLEDRSIRKGEELALAQARDYDVAIGARIQRALLLGEPEREYSTFELASMTLPSQKIDGDFIDFFDCGGEILDLMIGDVMGKGIPAALTGAAARNAFARARMSQHEEPGEALLPVKRIVEAAEKRMAGKLMEVRTFFTLVYGRIDGNAGLFRFVDCGHTSVIHYEKRSGRCWRLKGANAPMGFLPEQDYVEYAVPIDRGDLLFLYSDGITEATDSEGEQFGEGRLLKLIRSSAGLGASELLEKIKQITFSYAAGKFSDDVTGISIRMLAKPRNLGAASRTFPQSLDSLHAIREYFARCIDARLSASISVETREAVLIAIGEAASNIFKHNTPDEDRTCAAAFRMTDSWASFSLYYRGVDYDWQEWHVPSVENFQTSGYGLYLIGESMDSVTVSAGDDGYIRLCMLLYLPAGRRA